MHLVGCKESCDSLEASHYRAILQFLFVLVDEHLVSLFRAILTFQAFAIDQGCALDTAVRIYFGYNEECSSSVSGCRFSLAEDGVFTSKVAGPQMCHLCLTVMGQISIPSLVLMSNYLCK